LSCGLINDNQIAKYFKKGTLTDDGKLLYQVILSSLILTPVSMEISQNDGVKSSTKAIVNGIIPAIKNKSFSIGSLTSDINLALQLKSKAVSSQIGSITQYISEPELFGEQKEVKFEPAVIGYYLSKGGNKFKQNLLTYNRSMVENQSANMFGDPLSPEVVFYETFVENLPFFEKILILRRFNDYIASLEISIEDYKKSLKTAKPESIKEIEEMIKSLVEIRNFAI